MPPFFARSTDELRAHEEAMTLLRAERETIRRELHGRLKRPA